MRHIGDFKVQDERVLIRELESSLIDLVRGVLVCIKK